MANMKSSWADDSDDDSKPQAPTSEWKGWNVPAKTAAPKEEVKAKPLPDQDYPTLNGPAPRRSHAPPSSHPRRDDDHDAAPRGDRYEPPRRSNDGSYNDAPPRGPRGDGGYERRDSYDRPPRGDFNDRPPRGDFNDRRDSNDRPPRGDFNDRRDSYDRPPRGDFNDRPPRGDFNERRDSFNRQGRGGDFEGEEGGFDRQFSGGRDRYEYRDNRDRDGYNRQPREQRPPRAKLPIPDKPPYIAYIGHLNYDLKPEEVKDFFNCDCEVKLVTFHDTGKPRGYGYVTFETVEELQSALQRDGEELLGMNIKVDVSEGPRQQASSSTNWGRDRESRPDREFRGGDREFRGGDREFRGGDRGDRENRGDREFRGEREFRGGDRERGDRGEKERDVEEKEHEIPAERPKLVLAPRSVNGPESPASPTSPTSPSGEDAKSPTTNNQSKSNPFGAAKPRDELAIQRAFEERQREKERLEKEKAEKERAEKEPAAEKGDDSQARRPPAGGDRREPRKDRDDRAPISGNTAPRGGERRDFDRRDNRDNRGDRNDRPPRDFNNRDNRDNRGDRNDRPPRDFNNRDNRDNRDNRPRPPQQGGDTRTPPKTSAPPAAVAKDAAVNKDKDNKVAKTPAPATAKPVAEKKGKKEVANQFAVLNINETECP